MDEPTADTDLTPETLAPAEDVPTEDGPDPIGDRLWVRAITPLIEHRSRESDPSDRVQLAMDRMYIAACERLVRILGSDASE